MRVVPARRAFPMRWSLKDLVLFTGALYGFAWLVARSKLLRRPRRALARIPFLGDLVPCIVCTAAWVSVGLIVLMPRVTLFSEGLKPHRSADALILVGWALFSSWALSRALGDAE